MPHTTWVESVMASLRPVLKRAIGWHEFRSRLVFSVILGFGGLLFALSSSAATVQVQIQPTSPQLGDTISVIVQGQPEGTAPTVVMNQQTYPTFALSNNRYRAFIPTTPLDQPSRLTIQVNAGTEVRNLAVELRNRSFPTQSIWVNGGGSDGTDAEFDRIDQFKAIVSPEKMWNGAFRRPAEGEVSSVYGVRRYYNGEFAEDYYHRGVDYAGATGSPIYAPAAGTVRLVGREADGFQLHGNTIGLDHGQGVTSLFIHLSQINVQEGDVVQAGQKIGALGATGSATGPNLHWGLNVNGKSIDPVPWREAGFE
jgi:murein DD-endopeptidase MepM/ murein hydrolase activator NlpD